MRPGTGHRFATEPACAVLLPPAADRLSAVGRRGCYCWRGSADRLFSNEGRKPNSVRHLPLWALGLCGCGLLSECKNKVATEIRLRGSNLMFEIAYRYHKTQWWWVFIIVPKSYRVNKIAGI